MRPRSALCGCCENTLLWDVETGFLYGRWRVGRSRLSSYFEGMSSGGRLVESVDYLLSCQCVIADSIRSSGFSLQCENWCRGGRLRKEAGGG